MIPGTEIRKQSAPPAHLPSKRCDTTVHLLSLNDQNFISVNILARDEPSLRGTAYSCTLTDRERV